MAKGSHSRSSDPESMDTRSESPPRIHLTPQLVLSGFSISYNAAVFIVIIITGYYYLREVFFVPLVGVTLVAGGGVLIGSTTGGIAPDKKLSSDDYPRLVEQIHRLTDTMRVQEPAITIYRSAYPHAKVVPHISNRRDALQVSEALLTELEPASTEAILAHELGHLKNRDHHFRLYSAVVEVTAAFTGLTIITASIAGLLGVQFLTVYPYSSGLSLAHIAATCTGAVLWYAGHAAAGQYRQTAEYVADATASRFVGGSHLYQALLELHPDERPPDTRLWLLQLTNDYPSLEDRLAHIQLRINQFD